MSDGFTLDTKPQINLWVLVSRRHQVQMHLKGFKVAGIVNALKRDIGDHGNRVANYVVPIEEAISEAGGEVSYNIVNMQVLRSDDGEMFLDAGVFDNQEDALAAFPDLADQTRLGAAVIMLTLDPVRKANRQVFFFA